jgi:hypothetical protein
MCSIKCQTKKKRPAHAEPTSFAMCCAFQVILAIPKQGKKKVAFVFMRMRLLFFSFLTSSTPSFKLFICLKYPMHVQFGIVPDIQDPRYRRPKH